MPCHEKIRRRAPELDVRRFLHPQGDAFAGAKAGEKIGRSVRNDGGKLGA